MNSPALVSILIPCHNAARWLPATLESAIGQTWPNKEIIVVDDGSTDDSLARAHEFVPRGVHVLAQPNRGASAARNAALAASRGAWVQFLDADDLLAPDKIERQMELGAHTGPGFVISSRWARFVSSPADARFVRQPLCVDADPVEWIIVKLRDSAMMHPAAWLISRPLIEAAGGWDETLSLDDDGEYFSRVVLKSRGVRHCDAAVAYYRSNLAGSLSTRRSASAWASAFRSQQLCAERLLACETSARTRSACANLFRRLAFQMYPDCPDLVARCEQQVRRFGGTALRPEGGQSFQLAASIVGWKAAKRLQHLIRRSRP